ncbi:hypothetical protein N0V83_000006 [Neocucurbitaria cava]|uniref:N-acetyltransferase domain-containing protein n=1 Tax=Neocucurbitaria cava TaxID=798079 RepID=A0A9W9CRK7_9PLEO|nr:hypothetical protein N0V83_000006 [Neocucurbitaria cava]
MSAQTSEYASPAFVLLTDRLIIVPTPIAISVPLYRKLYASLHASPAFCEMAFSHHFPAVTWNDQQTYEVIHTRDVVRCWAKRGLGDFAVGVRPKDEVLGGSRRVIEGSSPACTIVELSSPTALNDVEWAGYAGVRNAITTSLPDQEPNDPPLPPWQEMIELRYGVAQDYWGKGLAREAAEAVMQWAVSERGIKKFIAETEKTNPRSGRVLEKMGFRMSGTTYWKEPTEDEWERVAI